MKYSLSFHEENRLDLRSVDKRLSRRKALGMMSAVCAGIALALRWSSPTTALRYARELAVGNNAAARVLGRLRAGGTAPQA